MIVGYRVIETWARRVVEEADRAMNQIRRKRRAGEMEGVVDHDVVLDRLINCLDEFEGYQRSTTQMQMHDEMIAAILPRIYGDDLSTNIDRLLQKLHRTEIRQEVLIVAQRRLGKSFGTAIFATSCLVAIPNIRIAVLGTTRDSARRIIQIVHNLVEHHAQARDMMIRPTSVDKVRLRSSTQGDVRVLESYAGKSRSVRGFDADIIIVDEAAYIEPGLFYEGILPVCAQGKTSLICLSTPGGRDNFYSAILTAKARDTDDCKETVFYGMRIGGYCDACAASGDPVQRILCSHVSAELPPWLSAVKQQRFQTLYKGQEHIFKREFLGLISDEGSGLIRPEFIDAMMNRPRNIGPHSPIVFVGIDPSGGGKSETAMTMLVMNQGAVLVGLGKTDVGHQMLMQNAFLRSMIGAVRGRLAYVHSTFVVACEDMPGPAASVASGQLEGVDNVFFMHEMPGRRIGVPMNETIMSRMSYLLQASMATGSMTIASDLVVCGHGGIVESSEKMLKKLFQEMRQLSWTQVTKSTIGADKYKLTAKTSNDSADLLMSFLHALYWSRVFLNTTDPDYLTVLRR